MDAIRPWLFIGKYRETLDAALLSKNKIQSKLHLATPRIIKSVQSVADAIDYPQLNSLYLAVEDGAPLPVEKLREGVDFVLAEKNLGRIVLISCGAGISRSATFAIAVVKETENVRLLEALRSVKHCHPVTQPHPALWESLCDYYGETVSFYSILDAVR
jgi:protein-tyrosine phosphatase